MDDLEETGCHTKPFSNVIWALYRKPGRGSFGKSWGDVAEEYFCMAEEPASSPDPPGRVGWE